MAREKAEIKEFLEQSDKDVEESRAAFKTASKNLEKGL